MKIWVRFSSVKASDHPTINNMLSQRSNEVAAPAIEAANAVVENVRIIPGRSTFNYGETMFRVIDMQNNIVCAKVLIMRNLDYLHGDTISFHINNVKQYVLDSSNR